MLADVPPILVTGSHRSGTTWVGRILSSAPSTAYIHEPFHLYDGPAVCSAQFDCWFTYVCDRNEHRYREAFEQMLSAAAPRRAIIKDPIAVFSAPWLAERFHTRNVVMLRHPAAFAASLKANGWVHPFADFLRQPSLMADRLEPFAREIMRFTRQEQDVVDQAVLLWRIIYSVVWQYQGECPEWLYVRHEDLIRDPASQFRTLFERLGLTYGPDTERAIESRRTEPTPWRTRLTAAEAERVRAGVGELASRFYTEDEW